MDEWQLNDALLAEHSQLLGSYQDDDQGFDPAVVDDYLNPSPIGSQVQRKAMQETMAAPTTAEPKPRLLKSLSGLLKQPKPLQWAVKGLIEHNTIATIFGPSGGGKSFVAISLAAAVATGRDWYGRKVKQGPVLYLNGEGEAGILRRFKAWSVDTGEPLEDAPISITERPVLFGNTELLNQLSAEVDEMPVPPALVVVDTLARATAGMEENSAKDMGLFVEALDALRRRYGCTVLVIHHTGKSTIDAARGSSALKAAWDVEIGLAPTDSDGGRFLLNCTKMKDAERFDPMAFKFRSVPLPTWQDEDGTPAGWIDEDGEQLKSAVLDLTDSEAKPDTGTEGRKRLSEKEAIALSCLRELHDKQVQAQMESDRYDPSNPPHVLKDDWYEAMKLHAAFPKDTHRQYPGKLESAKYVERGGSSRYPTYRPI